MATIEHEETFVVLRYKHDVPLHERRHSRTLGSYETTEEAEANMGSDGLLQAEERTYYWEEEVEDDEEVDEGS